MILLFWGELSDGFFFSALILFKGPSHKRRLEDSPERGEIAHERVAKKPKVDYVSTRVVFFPLCAL